MVNTFDVTKFEASLRHFLKAVPKVPTPAIRDGVQEARAERLCRELRKLAKIITEMGEIFDPVRAPVGQIELFAPTTIGRLIGQELTKVVRQPLGGVGDFYGSGVYAIYYNGDFPAYAAITRTDCPIYVGVAHPRSRHAKTPTQQGRSLAKRLSDHRKNIIAANKSISIDDFQYRYLVTESGWQGTAEEFLIWLFWPVWNKEMKVCSGFGKHGDKARKELSAWDILHGGRKWSVDQKSLKGKSAETVKKDVQAHYFKRLHADTGFWSHAFNPDWVKQNVS